MLFRSLALTLLVLLWPLLVLCEFRPWELLEPRSLRATGRFLVQFLTPRVDAEFLIMVAGDTWRTIAHIFYAVPAGIAFCF